MPVTDDPSDPRLGHGLDVEETKQSEVYLVLSKEERAKGLVRPVRRTYIHEYWEDGRTDLIDDFISRKGLLGCGQATKMSVAIAETYARKPKFYETTWCVGCSKHLPVAEFHWEDGTQVGS